MHQLVFDSADAFHPCDTSKFHKYDVQYLLSNKIDNKSIAIVNRFRIIGSIPRCPCRGSFSSDFHWMGCRCCSASDLLAIHVGEDDVRSDLSAHERARVQLLPQMNVTIFGFRSPGCYCRMLRVAPCLLDPILRCPSGHPRTCLLIKRCPTL